MIDLIISLAVPLYIELVSVTKLTLFIVRLQGVQINDLITQEILNERKG